MRRSCPGKTGSEQYKRGILPCQNETFLIALWIYNDIWHLPLLSHCKFKLWQQSFADTGFKYIIYTIILYSDSIFIRVFQTALGCGGKSLPPSGGKGTRNFAGGNFFFFTGGGELHKEYFQSFEAFVMLKLIFHIYWTSVNENWHQTLI